MTSKVRSWARLDVHARSVLAVTMDGESGELRSCRLPADTAKVVGYLAGLPGPTRAAYEAGPTGYGLARELRTAGVDCVVAAPGKIERPAQDKYPPDGVDLHAQARWRLVVWHRVSLRSGRRRGVREQAPYCGP